jgi:hypothetical protein
LIIIIFLSSLVLLQTTYNLILQVSEEGTSPLAMEHPIEREEGEVLPDPLTLVPVSHPICGADPEFL